jgi:hypothetical protein
MADSGDAFSISFESNVGLTGIGSSALSYSSISSTEIPQGVQFMNGSVRPVVKLPFTLSLAE